MQKSKKYKTRGKLEDKSTSLYKDVTMKNVSQSTSTLPSVATAKKVMMLTDLDQR